MGCPFHFWLREMDSNFRPTLCGARNLLFAIRRAKFDRGSSSSQATHRSFPRMHGKLVRSAAPPLPKKQAFGGPRNASLYLPQATLANATSYGAHKGSGILARKAITRRVLGVFRAERVPTKTDTIHVALLFYSGKSGCCIGDNCFYVFLLLRRCHALHQFLVIHVIINRQHDLLLQECRKLYRI